MERKYLIGEIISFCFEYKVFTKKVNIREIKESIDRQLEDTIFIENLINMIICKTKYRKNVDVARIKRLLLALEKIRLEMEYDGNQGRKC